MNWLRCRSAISSACIVIRVQAVQIGERLVQQQDERLVHESPGPAPHVAPSHRKAGADRHDRSHLVRPAGAPRRCGRAEPAVDHALPDREPHSALPCATDTASDPGTPGCERDQAVDLFPAYEDAAGAPLPHAMAAAHLTRPQRGHQRRVCGRRRRLASREIAVNPVTISATLSAIPADGRGPRTAG